MKSISISNIPAILTHVCLGEGDPVYFHGEPGCGKSEGVAAACRAVDADLIDIRLGQYDSVDLRGFPSVDRETSTTVWHAPATLPFVGNPRFDPKRKKLIFLDEINSANLPVQAVAYQLVQEGRIGEHILQPNTFIAAAGNRASDKGATNRLALPLANRFVHFAVQPDHEAWLDWAASAGMPSELMAFIAFRPSLLSTFDPSKPDLAFATARSWEKVGRYFKRPMDEDIKMAAMQGAVGEGPSVEFWGFVDVIKDMPRIADIIAKPDKVAVPERPEIKYAVAMGLSSVMDKQNIGACDTFLRRMDPEFGIMAWQLGLKRDTLLAGTKEFIAFADDYRAVWARK